MPPSAADRPSLHSVAEKARVEALKAEQARIEALKALLEHAERHGLALSRPVQDVVEQEATQLFNYSRDPTAAVDFSRTLKETAVRLFRQRRYREADARYGLASRFNPVDPTLVSNRATCMYNLAKYRKCIDLCLDVIHAFPHLGVDSPLLYCKVLLRMGRANIELDNFEEANATFDALTSMRRGLNHKFGAQIPEDQFNNLMRPFEKHLKAKISMSSSKQHGTGSSASSKNTSNKNMHDDDDDEDDDSDGEDVNYGYIKLDDLCLHIYPDGTGPCNHRFAEQGSSAADHDDGYGEPDLADSDPSDNDSVPSLASTDREDDGDSTDDHMPDLVSDEEDYSDSPDDEKDEAGSRSRGSRARSRSIPSDSRPPSSATKAGPQKQAAENMRLRDISEQVSQISASVKAKGKPIDVIASRSGTVNSKNAISSRNAGGSLSFTDSARTGFKRGFLADGSRSPFASIEQKPVSTSQKGSGSVANWILNSMSPEFSVVGKRDKAVPACYDTDDDQGPLTTGLFHERVEEDTTIMRREKDVKGNDSKNSISIGYVLRAVMGKSFQTNRTVDFTRIFGHHVAASSNSKRKKKSCEKNCGTCFARKMWKLRFISTELDEAEAALTNIETDSRRDRQTFLSTDLWQGTGYYASGYEMAFDVPALVHGVAYMMHLQCELHWRGDKVTYLKDAQHSFFSSLERNHHSNPNLEFLFMILMLIRDTVNLFALFPDPKPLEGTGRSFQFSRSASTVPQIAISTNAGDTGNNADIHEMLLTGNSENLSRNAYNWSRLGQIAKEEEWVYQIMLRDISHLITKLTNPSPRPPMYLEEGESFSEAFEKACGERSSEEKYWRCRIVTILDRERYRVIERKASEADDAGETEKGDQLLSCAIVGRPRQGRLFLRRAQIRAQGKQWEDSFSDIRTGIALSSELSHAEHVFMRCNPPAFCLKIDCYTLEFDVYFQKAIEARDRGQNAAEAMKMAIQAITKALACKPSDKRMDALLRDRLDVAKCLFPSMKTFASASKSSSEVQEHSETKVILGPSETSTGDQKAEAKRNRGTDFTVEAGGSASGDAAKGTSRRKKRKPKKPQQKAPPKPVPSTVEPESDSSSSDGGESALAGNPYAALLDDGPVPVQQMHRETVPSPLPTGVSTGREFVQRAPREQLHVRRPAQPPASVDMIQWRGEASPSSRVPGSRLECLLCDIRFSGKNDFDSHMKGRRHRTAMAHARAAGQTPAEWRARTSHPTQRSLPSRRMTASGQASFAPNERHHVNSQAHGPTREEALAEVERAVAILGGEARPCDIIPRMRFSKWNIRDVNAYLESKFGGLLRLCLQGTQMFQIRPGTESRPVLKWIDPNEGPSNRAEVQSHPAASRPALTTTQNAGLTPSSQRNGNGESSTSSNLTEMLRDQLRLSSANQRRGEADDGSTDTSQSRMPRPKSAAMDGPGECGICYDNVPDIRLIPCGHEWCTPCIAENIIDRGRDECPVCRQTVQRTELLYDELD